MIFNVFILNIPFLQEDPNGYKESWLGLVYKCGKRPVQTPGESVIFFIWNLDVHLGLVHIYGKNDAQNQIKDFLDC